MLLLAAEGVSIEKTLYCNSLYLPTSGGTASSLNYYEENTNTSMTFTLLWASNLTTTAHFVRVGNTVSMTILAVNGTTNTGSYNHLQTTGTLPSRFCLASSSVLPCVISNNGSDILGTVVIGNTGTFTVYNLSGNFDTGVSVGLETQTLTALVTSCCDQFHFHHESCCH